MVVQHVEPLCTRVIRNSIPVVDGLPSPKGNYSFYFVLTNSIPGAIKRFEDSSFGMKRIEIVCANCGGHLVFTFSYIYSNTSRDMYSKEKVTVVKMDLKLTNDIASTASL